MCGAREPARLECASRQQRWQREVHWKRAGALAKLMGGQWKDTTGERAGTWGIFDAATQAATGGKGLERGESSMLPPKRQRLATGGDGPERRESSTLPPKRQLAASGGSRPERGKSSTLLPQQ